MSAQQYWVVRGLGYYYDKTTFRGFLDQVNKLIQDGWQPVGGVSVSMRSGGDWIVYAQAMVR